MTEVTDQMSMAGQHQAEVHGNDVASTSEQKPDIVKSESGKIMSFQFASLVLRVLLCVDFVS